MKLKTLRLIIISLISCLLVSLPLVTSGLLAQNSNLILSQSSLIEKIAELGTPNDPLYPKQWHLYGDFGTNWNRLHHYRMYHQYGKGVVVAIVDTGIDFDSEFDLNSDSFIEGYDVVAKENIDSVDESIDLDGHGTLMASVIGQASWNGIGAVGIAPNAKLMPIRVADSGNNIDLVNVTEGIKQAMEKGADVINISLAIQDTDIQKYINKQRVTGGKKSRYPKAKRYSNARNNIIGNFENTIEEAYRNNIVIVVAAGNYKKGKKSSDYMSQLFNNDNVIVVAGHNNHGQLSSYSSKDVIEGVDISAPGGEKDREHFLPIVTSLPDDAGTSLAAATVSGAAAIVIGEFKNCESWRNKNIHLPYKRDRERTDLKQQTKCPRYSARNIYNLLEKPQDFLDLSDDNHPKHISLTHMLLGHKEQFFGISHIKLSFSQEIPILNIYASDFAAYELIWHNTELGINGFLITSITLISKFLVFLISFIFPLALICGLFSNVEVNESATIQTNTLSKLEKKIKIREKRKSR